MAVEVLDPTAEEDRNEPSLAPRLATLRGATVCLLSNGKSGTKGLFDHLERLLRDRWGVAEVVRRTKANYSAPAEDELMAQSSGWAAMFAGIGD